MHPSISCGAGPRLSPPPHCLPSCQPHPCSTGLDPRVFFFFFLIFNFLFCSGDPRFLTRPPPASPSTWRAPLLWVTPLRAGVCIQRSFRCLANISSSWGYSDKPTECPFKVTVEQWPAGSPRAIRLSKGHTGSQGSGHRF